MVIKKLDFKKKLLLAPMSNITNLPFRLMCKKYGADFVYSEMINCDAYLMKNKKTEKRAYFFEKERPVGIQIFGSSIEKLTKAAKRIEKELNPDLIDINIGCPAYNVMKTGGGASLLKSPEIFQIIKSISSSITIPLTCKIRILSKDAETIKIAKLIEKSGAKALCVHGRTAKQGYSGKANWNIIKKIKKELKIPIILNGDIIDEFSAKKAFEETKCDSIMIGRAAIGNPYLFKKIKYYLKNGKILKEKTIQSKLKDFFEYIQLCEKNNFLDLVVIKTQATQFIKTYKGARKLRAEISSCKNIEQLKLVLNSNNLKSKLEI